MGTKAEIREDASHWLAPSGYCPPGFLFNKDPLSWGGTTHSSLGPPKPTGKKAIPHKPVTDLSDLGNPSTATPLPRYLILPGYNPS